MTDGEKKSPSGLWDSLSRMETSAAAHLMGKLAAFEQPYRDCYEAGVQAPTLVGKRHQESDMRVAALFLKRTLNDLRSVWVLSCFGYTSQAGSVAASLYENALAAACIAGFPSRTSEFLKEKSGELPWTPIQLSKMLAEQLREEALKEDQSFDDAEYEKAWSEVYSAYKWLCQIKHPTLPSATHDSLATNLKGAEYVVMAAPDVSDGNIPVKATVLMISLSRSYAAIRRFALSLEVDTKQSYYQDFIDRMKVSTPAALNAYKESTKRPLPFDIRHTSLARSWTKLKKAKTN